MTFAVYCITNTHNGRRYFGSSTCPARRWREHKSKLRSGKHANPALQNAWNKYGSECFVFSVVSTHETESAMRRAECRAIANFGLRRSYNIRPDSRSNRGYRHSEKTKARISASLKGRDTLSPEARERAAASLRGQPKAPHVVDALRKANRKLWQERGPEMRRKCRKLSDTEVIELRKQIAAGENYGALSEQYGLSRPAITLIKQRKRYADV